MLSIRELAVDPNPVLTTLEASAWPHLRDLHFFEVDGEVILLICVETPEVFWVLEELRKVKIPQNLIQLKVCLCWGGL